MFDDSPSFPSLYRRDFLVSSSLSLIAGLHSAGSACSAHDNANHEDNHNTPKVGAFSKSFQDRPIPEVCRIFKEIGLDGLDLTVRPGGHIEPENVAKELPQAAQAAREQGIEILFLTTSVTDADATAEQLLATAAEVGVKKIKLGYYRYTEFGSLAKQMDDVRRRITKVAKLCEKHGVLPCVHIHSGEFIPSHGSMLYQLIQDFRPNEVGAYVDPLHMTLEGGRDGWRQGLDLLAPWIKLCSVKNFRLEKAERDKTGQQRWHTRTVPVADGVCPLPDFVATLKKLNFAGPYSLHSEYKGRHSFRDLTTEECIKQTTADFRFFNKLL